jgi:hypothetical protein
MKITAFVLLFAVILVMEKTALAFVRSPYTAAGKRSRGVTIMDSETPSVAAMVAAGIFGLGLGVGMPWFIGFQADTAASRGKNLTEKVAALDCVHS